MSWKPSSTGTSSWAVSCTAVFLLALGCAELRTAPERSSGYASALAAWTQTAKLYRGLETKLNVRAVYLSPDFRKHYVDEYALAFNLSPADREEMLHQELERAEKREEFILIVNTTFSEENDLSENHSTWKVSLSRGEAKICDPEVERLDWKKDFISRFYPPHDLWARIYRVSFSGECTPGGTSPAAPLQLEIVGPAGKVDLTWAGKK